jgi:hypothetical protein
MESWPFSLALRKFHVGQLYLLAGVVLFNEQIEPDKSERKADWF